MKHLPACQMLKSTTTYWRAALKPRFAATIQQAQPAYAYTFQIGMFPSTF
jgi:hypothetical protein